MKYCIKHQIMSLEHCGSFTTIQDGEGGGKKFPPTSFSPVTSINVGISPQNFLTFSLNPFSTLV